MAKNVKINGVTYQAVPNVQIPMADGSGNATFYDTTSATADASKILAGYKAFNANGEVTGQATVPAVSQDASTKVITIS